MISKSKTDLFRFVSARAPQLIDEDRLALGFIEHPDPAGSHFSDGITGYTDLETARIAVRNAAENFPQGAKFGSINEVKDLVPVLWDFSNRLLKNRNQIDDEVLDQPSDSDLSTATITTNLKNFWEYVLYDILLRENRPVRQACIEDGIREKLKESGGNPVKLFDQTIHLNSREYGRPIFGTVSDTLAGGLTICWNDTWAYEIHIEQFDRINDGYLLKYKINLFDHFGLDITDLSEHHDRYALAGFRAWLLAAHP